MNHLKNEDVVFPKLFGESKTPKLSISMDPVFVNKINNIII